MHVLEKPLRGVGSVVRGCATPWSCHRGGSKHEEFVAEGNTFTGGELIELPAFCRESLEAAGA